MKKWPTLVCLLVVLLGAQKWAQAQAGVALPAMVARATDSLTALLAPARPATPPLQAGPLPEGPEPAQQSQQSLLQSVHMQAQRQLGQLNGLVANSGLAPNLTGGQYGNVLEVLSNVGKALQLSRGANHFQIVASEPSANIKKNEYQSLAGEQLGPQATPTSNSTATSNQYREQGEQLRQEIVRRAGQLQQVVASSMEVLKTSSDLIVRRLLEQLNSRLDQAKSKADKIINEPAQNEVAIRALHTINQGLNNLNNIITNIVNRLDIAAKDTSSAANNNQVQRASQAQGPINGNNLLDTTKLKLNLQQISQQFSSALQQQRLQAQAARQQVN